MTEVEQYVREVVRHVQASPQERQRIEADLRAHLEEAVRAGEVPSVVIARMGSPAEVAAEFMARRPLPYAGFWPRLAAFAVDMAVIVVLAGVAAFLALSFASVVPQKPR